MNTITRRIAAGFALAAAPIALGAATTSQAQATATDTGPHAVAPRHPVVVPHQQNIPEPGTRAHHHHQANHAE